ncbi:hypothetical protein ACFU7Y_07020 [Kitasatospora sp. NPDC057542]|uniref:hypothetical protein n=1 Tax=Kitasatospora sp. NPDC057542 TaxID=3346162 RepID=UPI0036AA556A
MSETEEQDEALPELRDLCGTVISDGSEYHALVRDSSVTHRTDPRLDGKRFITACSPEHGRQLIEQYQDRPFVEAELQAGKTGRALLERPSIARPTFR